MQNPLTVIARIKAGQDTALKTLLADIGAAPANNNIFPFAHLTRVHFARFVIIDNAKPDTAKSLYFESVFDGTLDQHLDEMLIQIGAGLDTVWGYCEDYLPNAFQNPAGFKQFIIKHSLPYIVYYSAYPDETVPMVHADTRLRRAIEGALDQSPIAKFLDVLAEVWNATSR